MLSSVVCGGRGDVERLVHVSAVPKTFDVGHAVLDAHLWAANILLSSKIPMEAALQMGLSIVTWCSWFS
ncbi:hypothetical protein V5799_014849 [Amblyomma americanum]|uniref:Uncharacterized protein n=1 Tax=Amblyomma americanum TaxID=6943 RepID=A0AAQ4E1U7_AMBAM